MPQPRTPRPASAPEAAAAADDSLAAIILPLFAIRGQLVELIEQTSRDVDIAPTEAVALLHLANQDMTVSEISRAAGLQRSGGSVLVERLHARRLVERVPDPLDHRVVRVSLTPGGRAIARTVLAQLSCDATALLERISASDRRRLAAGLQRLAAG